MRYEVVSRPDRDMLGEGPTWLADRGELLWVDILRPAIHRLSLDDGSIQTLEVDQPVGWALPIKNDSRFIAGFRDGFWKIDLDSGQRELIVSPETDRRDNRLNDAKIDAWGRIWAGSKDDTDRQASGALYRLDPDLKCRRVDDGYLVANGPTFSVDGKTLYHNDSGLRTVYAFDLDANGTIENKRIWRVFPEEWGYPDGMTTDRDGCLWIAHWGGAKLSRFDPDGDLIQAIDLPATNITSCAFAGTNLDRMFVTSSALGAEGEELAGALFEIDPGTAGLMPRAFG